MKNNGNYIKLPTLRSISVNNYPLFKKSWSYKIKNGLNLFLGANGFGKTTTINLIIYGIVGAWKESAIDSDGKERVVDELLADYFADREHEGLRKEYEKNALATVIVEFAMESTKIIVERSLKPMRLIRFSVDGNQIVPDKSHTLEAAYQKRILNMCALDNIDDLSFILRKLIVREEEGNYLLWNRDDQSKIIRLLFNPPGFFSTFKEIQKDTTQAHSKMNRHTDFRGQFESKRNVLLEEREALIKRVSGELDQFQLKKKYDEQRNAEIALREDNDKILDNISYISNEISDREEKANSLSSDIDAARENIGALEDKYFTSIYHDPRIRLIYNKVEQRKSCIFCNNLIDAERARAIVGAVKHNHCPVCNSDIQESHEANPQPPQDVINKLQQLREETAQRETELANTLTAKSLLDSELTQHWKEQNEIQNKLSVVRRDLGELKYALEKTRNSSEPTSELDLAIQKYDASIDEYQETIDKARKEYLNNKVKLDKLNAQLTVRVNELASGLNEGFSKYSKEFYFKDLNLTTYEKQQKNLKLSSFCPVLEGKRRLTEKSVSKSEAIMLEYVFRMSLINHYYAVTNCRPFLILESSEGAFDIVRTEQLADTFTEYGKKDFPFISITNLSKPPFVRKILDSMKNAKTRIFNFIEVGAHDELLDKQQLLEKQRYAKELQKLGV